MKTILDTLLAEPAVIAEIKAYGRKNRSDPFAVARLTSHLQNGILSKAEILDKKRTYVA